MKIKDVQRRKNEKLSELEEEEREKREYLKERANAQRQEQEDEIKKLNEVLINNIKYTFIEWSLLDSLLFQIGLDR